MYLTSVNWEQICSHIHVNFAWDTRSFFFPFLVSIHNSTSLLPSQKDSSACPSAPSRAGTRWHCCSPLSPRLHGSATATHQDLLLWSSYVVDTFLAASIQTPPTVSVSTMSTPALNFSSYTGIPPTPSAQLFNTSRDTLVITQNRPS